MLCRCDNAAVVAILKSRYSRDEDLMHLFRCLFFLEAAGGFGVLAQHIPGVHNELADNLSRNRASSLLSKVPVMKKVPTPLPSGAVELLLQPDWLSEDWMGLFGTF